MSYNVANFDQVTQSDGVDGIIQLSDGNLGFKGANNVTINAYGDITANAIFAYGAGGGGGGGNDTLSDVVNRGNVVSNSIVVYGNITANYFSGNANLLSNIVNSDIAPGVYGNATAVSQITIGADHRITSISNVVIAQSNLDQVVNRGNVTSNSIEVLGNVSASYFMGNANLLSNIVNSDITPGVYGSATYVPQITIGTDHRINTISSVLISGVGSVSNLDQVVNLGNVTSNSIQILGNVVTSNYFMGNANLLSNIVNSDIAPGVYGNTTAVSQITIGADHRITSISNVVIAQSNLDQVVNRGNVTSNSIEVLGNVSASYFLGNANLLSNIVNSDIAPGVYGNATAVSQITIGADHRITSISNVVIAQSNLDQVVNRGNVTSNSIQVLGDVSASYFLGNANLLSNIVNSDIAPGVYGSSTTVSQITIGADHRISSISSVSISGGGGGSSNLDQVANLGNVTSNSLIMSNLLVGNTATVSNIVVTNARGANPTLTSGNVLVVDQNFKSYKTFRVLTFGSNRIEGIQLSNTVDGCQTFIDIYPQSNIIDVFQSLSHGTGTTLLQSYTANLYINSLAHGIISCLTDNGNTFININTYI